MAGLSYLQTESCSFSPSITSSNTSNRGHSQALFPSAVSPAELLCGVSSRGELAAQPPPQQKQEKELALVIPSELKRFTVHERCISLPRWAEIRS